MRWGGGMVSCTSDAVACGRSTSLRRIGKVLQTDRHRPTNEGEYCDAGPRWSGEMQAISVLAAPFSEPWLGFAKVS